MSLVRSGISFFQSYGLHCGEAVMAPLRGLLRISFLFVVLFSACSRAPEPPLAPPGASVEDAANSMASAEKKPGAKPKK